MYSCLLINTLQAPNGEIALELLKENEVDIVITIQNMLRTRRRMLERYSKTLEVETERITFNAMDEALLKRAVTIVEENMDNIEFSTDEFARKRWFNEARKLLKDRRYTVSEVSRMAGFNTPSYFATSFKKYFGCLPTEYMKQRKG